MNSSLPCYDIKALRWPDICTLVAAAAHETVTQVAAMEPAAKNECRTQIDFVNIYAFCFQARRVPCTLSTGFFIMDERQNMVDPRYGTPVNYSNFLDLSLPFESALYLEAMELFENIAQLQPLDRQLAFRCVGETFLWRREILSAFLLKFSISTTSWKQYHSSLRVFLRTLQLPLESGLRELIDYLANDSQALDRVFAAYSLKNAFCQYNIKTTAGHISAVRKFVQFINFQDPTADFQTTFSTALTRVFAASPEKAETVHMSCLIGAAKHAAEGRYDQELICMSETFLLASWLMLRKQEVFRQIWEKIDISSWPEHISATVMQGKWASGDRLTATFRVPACLNDISFRDILVNIKTRQKLSASAGNLLDFVFVQNFSSKSMLQESAFDKCFARYIHFLKALYPELKPKRITFHSARRSGITHHTVLSKDLAQVSIAARHRSKSVTRGYVQLTKQHMSQIDKETATSDIAYEKKILTVSL